MRSLRIGVPSKGRLSELATHLLQQAGLSFRRQNRSLFAKVREMPVDVTFLRTDDIPVLCAEGAIDMGITGSDLVIESGASVQERMKLNVGKCRLALCVPDESAYHKVEDLEGCRVATSFPHTTQQFLQQHGVSCHLVQLTGSVEVMVSLGVADVIVDLVETGSTLAANRLRVMDNIGHYETVLIQNQQLDDDIETVFLMADVSLQPIASKLVKEIALYGGDITPFVSKDVCEEVIARVEKVGRKGDY